MILVGGLPGSGKSKLAKYLVRLLAQENVNAVAHILPAVESTKYNTQKFVQTVLSVQEYFQDDNARPVIVAVLPSYCHLKKAIYELKKDETFKAMVDIKHIITKVHARNFYQTRHRNHYQFLIENCMKGVTQAIIFEKSNVNSNELQIMQKVLLNANFDGNLLMTSGRTFALSDLIKILVINANDTFNFIYNKFFYGFEKEGKSQFFQSKAVQGVYIPYRYPVKESQVGNLSKAIMVAVSNPENQLIPKSEEQIRREEEDKENRR